MDTNTMERSHKTSSKRPANLTQKHHGTFLPQLAARYSDNRLVKRFRTYFRVDRLLDKTLGKVMQSEDAAVDDAMDSEDSEKSDKPIATGSHFTLGFDRHGKAAVKWRKRPGRQSHLQAVQDLVAEVVLTKLPEGADVLIHGFSDYKFRIENKEVLFRAHPSYRSVSRQQRDVWYDWAMFDLDNQGFGKALIPGQLLMFIHVPYLGDEVKHRGVRLVPNQPHAVVRLFQSAPKKFRSRNSRTDYSTLVRFGKTRDHLHIIPCNRIAAPTIVVPNVELKRGILSRLSKKRRMNLDLAISPLGPGYFVVSPMDEWGDAFGRLIRSFPKTV